MSNQAPFAPGLRAKGVMGIGLCVAVLLSTLATNAQAQAINDRQTFNIPASPLGSALRQFGRQSGQRIIFGEDMTGGQRAPAVHGGMTSRAALGRLLAGSGLTYTVSPAGVIMITRTAPSTTPQPEPMVDETPVEVDPVLVFAFKRPVQSIKTPASMTTVREADFRELGIQNLADVAQRSPSAQINRLAPGLSSMTIRGVATTVGRDRGQSTTGYFIDGVSVTDPYFAGRAIDLDTFDLQSVTILRGPQTTIYGVSAFSGAVNYQTQTPRTSELAGRLQLGATAASGGDQSASVRGMINLPIIPDTLAVRASYVQNTSPGYIDNTGTGATNVNRDSTEAVRLQALWTPTSGTKLHMLHMSQSQDTRDLGYQNAATPGQKTTPSPEVGGADIELTSLRLDQDIGRHALTITSHRSQKNTRFTVSDLGSGSDQAEGVELMASRTRGGEIRIASHAGSRLSYMTGASIEETEADLTNSVSLNDDLAFILDKLTYKASIHAIFADASYELTPQWTAEIGGRFYALKNREALSTTESYSGQVHTGELSGRMSTSGFTPRASLTWSPNSDFATWISVAEGARYPGHNLRLPDELIGSPAFDSDRLTSLEVGARGRLSSHNLSWDAAVFHGRWRKTQIHIPSIGFGLTENHPALTEIHGFEATAQWGLKPNMLLRANIGYLDARLRAGGAFAATILPGAAKWRMAEDLVIDLPNLAFQPRLTLSHRFQSEAPSELGGTARQGDYHIFSARLAAPVRGVDLTFAVDNITNSKGAACNCGTQQFIEPPLRLGIYIDRYF